MNTPFLAQSTRTGLLAGQAILKIYGSTDFGIETKADNSPLTQADRASHQIIHDALIATNLPILSEEGRNIPHAERRDWTTFWLVDPLDGTKEFIKRNGEFTVNIALIEQGAPILGVVFAPVLDRLYFASTAVGAFRLDNATRFMDAPFEAILAAASPLPQSAAPRPYTIVGSRSHPSPEFADFVATAKIQHEQIEVRSIGSSLKICLVAEGSADVYPRLGPTMEWDTAAGHAVAIHAGCSVTRADTGEALVYNKENLLNPFFIVERR